MLDFEQLAFIEKWRQKASRGVVVALDGRTGDIVVTIRVGEGGAQVDMRGQDATGAVRKQRLAIGDRITMAIEYAAKDVARGSGTLTSLAERGPQPQRHGLIAPGAKVQGVVKETGEIAVVDCGANVLVRGETLGAVKVGDAIAFTVAAEGKAYLIPSRG